MEDRSRRNNIRVEGVAESENENWATTKEKLRDIIKNNLGIKENVIIERAHRGNRQKQSQKPRPIVAILYEDKENVMQHAKKLKGTGIYINEDYSRETVIIRQNLWDEVKTLRDQGKYAKLQYDRIVSRDFRY